MGEQTASADPTSVGGQLRELFRVPHDPTGITLVGFDTRATPLAPSRSDAVEEFREELRPALHDAHELLLAHADHAVLLVLQGLDASGKSGTIKHVASAMNPVGVRVTSFTEPDSEEEDEPFLARIERALPQRGELGVFDRSHYEDAIVPAVEERDADDVIDRRVAVIRAFEERLVADDTVVIKCLLNISYDEQR